LGERVVALGYALALPGGPTVTSGIVSSLDRTIQVQDPSAGITRTYQDALQTDAAINPGNSGGPLVDLNGNVIGIDSAGTESAQNIGFAIAIDAARPVIELAILHPKAAVAYLGVTTETVNAGTAAQFGLGASKGALVVAVSPNGPAQKAGIAQGEVIVRFDGTAITSSDGLGSLIERHKPGDRVSVVVVASNGSQRTVTVALGTRPGP
jgi:S1-C subfamily serine protease